MYNKQTSAFIRIPFTVAGKVPALLLRVRYDDGFVAYLNGVEVARALFQGVPKWNSVSENRMVNDESKLLLVDPKPTEYKKVTEFQTGLNIVDSGYPKKSQFAWTHPVVANGKVYVRYCNQLICYDIEN